MSLDLDTNTAAMLALLQADLGYPSPGEFAEGYMLSCLKTAIARITAAGVNFDPAADDHRQAAEMYAAWLYRHRDAGSAMPPMVRLALNDLKVAEVGE